MSSAAYLITCGSSKKRLKICVGTISKASPLIPLHHSTNNRLGENRLFTKTDREGHFWRGKYPAYCRSRMRSYSSTYIYVRRSQTTVTDSTAVSLCMQSCNRIVRVLATATDVLLGLRLTHTSHALKLSSWRLRTRLHVCCQKAGDAAGFPGGAKKTGNTTLSLNRVHRPPAAAQVSVRRTGTIARGFSNEAS